MNQILRCRLIIFNLSKLFQGRCWLCHGKCIDGKGFLIHHRGYIPGEKTYKDFGAGKSSPGDRLAYYEYLEPIVRKNPKRFRCLHASCHSAVEKLRRWKKSNRKRLIKLANELD